MPARGRREQIAGSISLLALLLLVALTGAPAARAQAATPAALALPTDPSQPCPAPTALRDAATAGPNAPVYDYAIAIDVSGSMNGDFDLDGTPDPVNPTSGQPIPPDRVIFPKVKNAVEQFIDAAPPGANVAVIPFGNGVDPGRTHVFALTTPAQSAEARAYVDGLQATDGFTHITEAVQAALAQLQALKAADPDRDHYQTILLYTDGQGNGPGDGAPGAPSVDALLANIDAYKTSQPFLFVKYVGLGIDVPNKDQLEAAGVQVVQEQSGQVSPIRELRLAIVGGDLGDLRPGDVAASRVCIVAGDLSGNPRLTFTLARGDLPDDVDLQLDTRSKFVDASGVPLRWTLAKGGAPGDYAAYLDVAADDKEIVLVPARLPVQFTVAAPPTPTPSPTSTPTPVPPTPTPTPVPTAIPTGTPLPTATPTATPIPTSTPIPTPTPLPTSTPTPVPLAGISIGPWTKPAVKTTDDPNGSVEWTAPVTAKLEHGAQPVIRLEVDPHEPPLDPAPKAFFQVGGQGEFETLRLDGNQRDVQAVVRAPAGALQALGTADPQVLTGAVVVDPRGGDARLDNGVRREDGTFAAPMRLEAKVYTPIDPRPFVLGGLAAAALAALIAAFFAFRPALPANAALATGSGRGATSVNLRQHQRGLIPGGVDIGGMGSPVGLGLRQAAGTVSGRWGAPRRARIVAARPLKVDNLPVQPGAHADLADGSKIQVDNQTFRYHQ